MKKREKSGLKSEKSERKKVIFERIPSGIFGFDELIQGGIEKNSVNIVVGSSGSGKTIFTMQFLMEGVKNGENTLYITFEEKKDEFFRNMSEFGWDLEKYEKEGKFVFLEYNPEKVRLMLEEGGGAIEGIVIKNKIKRIVIDSISSFILLFEEELAKREAALSLFNIIRKWDCTSVLTIQEEPSNRVDGSASSIEFEADSIILLYFVRYKAKRQRFIEILKMRGTKHSTEIHPIELGKNGFCIGGGILKEEFKY
jgi:circadian clock protein KaiC